MKIFINLIYLFYSKLIILEIIIRSKLFSNTKLLYSGWDGGFGFGDHVSFCVNIKSKINKNSKLFCYSDQQFEIANFFYDRKCLLKSIFSIPKFLSTSIIGLYFLKNNRNFKPQKLMSPHNKKLKLTLGYGTKNQIKHIKSRLKKFKISVKLKEILKDTTIVLFIKNYSHLKNMNKNINFQVRQTRDLNKIYKLLNNLKKKYKIIILGNKYDNFLKEVSDRKLIDNKTIYLFNNLSNKYSIADQVYLAENSSGFIGNGSGAMNFFDILKKKILLIDFIYMENLKLWKKNRNYLFKKVLNKQTNEEEIFNYYKKYDVDKYKIIENKFEEINKSIKNIKF